MTNFTLLSEENCRIFLNENSSNVSEIIAACKKNIIDCSKEGNISKISAAIGIAIRGLTDGKDNFDLAICGLTCAMAEIQREEKQ